MRCLISSDDALQAGIETQKRFFADHMQAWVGDLCAALEAHREARFYIPVARLAREFFAVEIQAFDMV
jgi:TorA maturation chaperone TorD